MFEKKTLVAEIVPNAEIVTISAERYEKLVKAETTLEIIKSSIPRVPNYVRDELLFSILGIKDGEKDGAK